MTDNQEPTLDEQTLYEVLTEQLGLKASDGLVDTKGVTDIPVSQRRIVDQAKKTGIDAIYFVNGNPIIYFRRLSADNDNQELIREMQHYIWNQGRVPFFFVITPGQIRVINAHALPTPAAKEIADKRHQIYPNINNKASSELLELRSIEQARQVISTILAPFNRDSIDSDNIWQDADIIKAIKNNNRIDQRLLKGLQDVRRNLEDKGLSPEIINDLLIRSFLIMYLQDRNALPETSKPLSGRENINYLEILKDPTSTYKLFDDLSKRFNGNVFYVSEEERLSVKNVHLELLRDMLFGADIGAGQPPLFRLYCFEHIPIEMISCMYEEFLKHQEEEKVGAFYTSPTLVSMLLDEVVDWSEIDEKIKILDPACGSGIFLVEAFHRLIDNWRNKNPDKTIDANTLQMMIQQNVYGVDVNRNAINVAALSLYLALLDNLEPEYIRKSLRKFPTLVGKNLLVNDFFDNDLHFEKNYFDLIVGNVPWESKLSEKAQKYIQKREYPVNDNQIALAFLWRAPDFCDQQGRICLIVSSKAVLFNRRGKKFRRRFFETYKIQKIIDFSMLRREKSVMFSQAIGPAAAIFYTKHPPEANENILYAVPAISSSTRWIGIPTVDPPDIKKLPLKWLLTNDRLWKTAFWGGPRDYLLIEQLEKLPKLKDFLAKYQRAKPQEGYKLAEPKKDKRPKEYNSDSIDSSSRVRYKLLPSDTKPLKKVEFYSFKNPQIYEPPVVVVRQSPSDGEIQAFFSDKRIIYPERFAGFPCNDEAIPYLKLLTLYFNSSIATYYYFLTSSEWGIERDNLQLTEHLDLPFIVPDFSDLSNKQSIFSRLLDEFDKVVKVRGEVLLMPHDKENIIRQHIDELFFDLFELTEAERDLVKDTTNYTIPFFTNPISEHSSETPDTRFIEEYLKIFKKTFIKTSRISEANFQGAIMHFERNSSLINSSRIIVGFTIDGRPMRELDDSSRKELISEIENKIVNPRLPPGQSLFSRHHIRYYSGNTFYIIKPKEYRFWTKSTAREDADGALSDLLNEYAFRLLRRGR